MSLAGYTEKGLQYFSKYSTLLNGAILIFVLL